MLDRARQNTTEMLEALLVQGYYERDLLPDWGVRFWEMNPAHRETYYVDIPKKDKQAIVKSLEAANEGKPEGEKTPINMLTISDTWLRGHLFWQGRQ